MNYLYNGVGPLPDIYSIYTPELQKELPFVILVDSTKNGSTYGSTSLWMFKTYDYSVRGTDWSVGIIASDGCKVCSYDYTDNQWGDVTNYTGAYPTLSSRHLAWSNFVILNPIDSTIYLAASDPIPVNPHNPTAMLMGYMAGQTNQRSRGLILSK